MTRLRPSKYSVVTSPRSFASSHTGSRGHEVRQASIVSSYVLSVRFEIHSRRSRIKLSTTESLIGLRRILTSGAPFSGQRQVSRQSRFLPRMRRVTTQAAFAESLTAGDGQSYEALCVVSDALRLVFASHSLAFCSAAKRAASTGIPSITIIVGSSYKQTREKCLGRLTLPTLCARPQAL